MRRSDREVTDSARIDAVIKDCDCLRLGFVTKEGAYILPVNFGFEHAGGVRRFYLHGANEGKKAALLRQGGSVAFELDCGHALNPAQEGCGYSYRYCSVMGRAEVTVLSSPEEKARALNCILQNYTQKDGWQFPPAALAETMAVMLTVTEISCKIHE